MTKRNVGLSTHESAYAARISDRQADYWVTTGLVAPSVADTIGTGNHRKFSIPDIIALAVLGEMRKHGVSLQSLRVVQRYLRSQKLGELQDLRAKLVWAPGNRRYPRDVALVFSDSEIVSLLTEPGQRIAPVVVNVGELYEQVQARLEEVRSARKIKAAEKKEKIAKRKLATKALHQKSVQAA